MLQRDRRDSTGRRGLKPGVTFDRHYPRTVILDGIPDLVIVSVYIDAKEVEFLRNAEFRK